MKKNIQLYIHTTLWIVYAFLLTLLINQTFSTSDSIIKATVLVTIQVALFYYNAQVLFPKLISNKKTWIYLLNIILILVALFLIFLWFERQFMPEALNEFGQYRMDRHPPDRNMRGPGPRSRLFNVSVLFDFLSLLIVLILSSANAAAFISRKKEIDEVEKSKENLSSEMTFLKSQINPHFLFNSLNNIYSLTLTGSERASDMIVKLSSMLRYILYECNVNYVVIEKEWDYILNFIDFQKLKSKDELNLQLEFNNESPGALISPMVFIPFIENAFKHSNIEDKNEGWIHISLNNKEDEVVFQVDNSKSSKELSKDEVGGIGLENVKRRLELVYASDFDLIINDSLNSYSIMLRIQKDKNN